MSSSRHLYSLDNVSRVRLTGGYYIPWRSAGLLLQYLLVEAGHRHHAVDTCQDWFLPPPFVWMLATGDPGHWCRGNTAGHSPGHVTTSRWRQVARAGAGPGLPQSRHHPSPTGFIIKYHLIHFLSNNRIFFRKFQSVCIYNFVNFTERKMQI